MDLKYLKIASVAVVLTTLFPRMLHTMGSSENVACRFRFEGMTQLQATAAQCGNNPKPLGWCCDPLAGEYGGKREEPLATGPFGFVIIQELKSSFP